MDNKKEKPLPSFLDQIFKSGNIKPENIPNIDLYMDQVTTFMDKHLASFKRHEDDKILTKTMINNYAKNRLLPPPNKKKYSKEHMLLLIFIYYFKNILSINDIQTLMKPLTSNFFSNHSDINLEEIYSEIFALSDGQLDKLMENIKGDYNLAAEQFTSVEEDADREYLQLFTFVCLLSFDVYLKKQMIESLIDNLDKKDHDKKK